MQKFIFLFFLNLLAMPLSAQSFIGDWKGSLSIQGTELPIVFHITETDGQLSATMDSPDQGAFNIATDTCFTEDGQLTIKASRMMLTFTATLQKDQLEGTFKQGMNELPLKMTRLIEPEVPAKRPQDPEPPFPYLSEEVFFSNPAVGIRLAGTLTRPKTGTPDKVLIMISGSGPQDRNAEIMNHRPFLVWADHLSRQGIAVLRFDERGVGASQGDFSSATSKDFASDVMAAVNFITAKEALKGASIGLMGHSEGGMIAPMITVEHPESIDFLVLLAAPGIPITDLMYEQYAMTIEGQGISDPMKSALLTQQRDIYTLVKNSQALSTQMLRDTIFSFYEQRNGGINLRENPQVKNAVNQFSSPWTRYFLAYDPQPTLAQLKIPVLAINGDKDTQVIAEQNIAGIKASLKAGGNNQLTTRVFPGLNHLFQTADTGQVTEYSQIEETVNSTILKYVSDWILALK